MKIMSKIRQLHIVPKKQIVSFELEGADALEQFRKLEGKELSDYRLELVKRKKKSKDINAYLWELCGLLAECPDCFENSDVEIYRKAVREAGCRNHWDGYVLKEEYAEMERTILDKHIGWDIVPYEIEFGDYIRYRVYYGSSLFDMEQMRILVDWVVNECEFYNIPTTILEPYIEKWSEEWKS